MGNIKFTTTKGTEYILSFEKLDNPYNIEVSFQTKDQGYKATNKGEVFEVMQIITDKIKTFLEKFKDKYPKKLNEFELFINPVSEDDEEELGDTEKNKRTQLYLRYINKNLDPSECRVEVIDSIIAIYYNTPEDMHYHYKIFNIGSRSSGKSYRIDYNKGSKNMDELWIMGQDLDPKTISFIKKYTGDIESLKQELTNKGIEVKDDIF
jgi:hypothetical protein